MSLPEVQASPWSRFLRFAAGVFRLRIAAGLRDARRDGYRAADLRADVFAGIAVALVALPLSMALAIAAGAPPQHGLYTAIVAGGVAGALGSSRAQIAGPTNNFVILAPIGAAYGLGGLVCASLFAGILLVFFAFGRVGRLIQFIPTTVTQGFTAAIGVAIMVLQVRDLLGIPTGKLPPHVFEQLPVYAAHLSAWNPADAAVGATALAILLLWPKTGSRLPAPLVALVVAAAGAEALRRVVPGAEAATIASRFGGMPAATPTFVFPWSLPGADGAPLNFDFALVRGLFPASFAIALLVAIESLLTAVVADAIMGTTHDPDAELMAQGTGNVAASFFGGFGATGALARTVTNVRAGAKSPVSAVVCALVLLLIAAFAGPLVAYLPMSGLAAVLLLSGWRLVDVEYSARLLRYSPPQDLVVLVACFALTLVFDMEIGVMAGVTLASLLFMRRMADAVGVRTAEMPAQASQRLAAVPGVLFFEVAGPFFFGAASKLVGRLKDVVGGARVLVLDVGLVPFVDATGLVSLEATLALLRKKGVPMFLCGVHGELRRAMKRARLEHEPGALEFFATRDDALAVAAERYGRPAPPA